MNFSRGTDPYNETCLVCGRHISRHYGGTEYRCYPNDLADEPLGETEVAALRAFAAGTGMATQVERVIRIALQAEELREDCRSFERELTTISRRPDRRQGESRVCFWLRRIGENLAAEADRADMAEKQLASLRQCSTCCGTPHTSGLPCVCGGTNSAEDEVKNLRLAAIRAEEHVAESNRHCETALENLARQVARAEAAERACDEWQGRAKRAVHLLREASEWLHQFDPFDTRDHGVQKKIDDFCREEAL